MERSYLYLEKGHRLEICSMNILGKSFRTVSDGSTLRNDGLLYCKTNILVLVTQTTEGSWFDSWQDLEILLFPKPPYPLWTPPPPPSFLLKGGGDALPMLKRPEREGNQSRIPNVEFSGNFSPHCNFVARAVYIFTINNIDNQLDTTITVY